MPLDRVPVPFPQETLARKDVARRQLSTAISLVLGNGDAVSANVLTWAATDILRGVAQFRKIDTFAATLEDRVKPEYLKDWRGLLREHYNYFKHSDKDPEKEITDFTPEATTWALFGACIDYVSVFKTRTWAILVYHMWFISRHPGITMEETQKLAVNLSPKLGFPAEKPLEESVKLAFEMLENDAGILSSLVAWGQSG